jgi:hypothetical protein
VAYSIPHLPWFIDEIFDAIASIVTDCLAAIVTRAVVTEDLAKWFRPAMLTSTDATSTFR